MSKTESIAQERLHNALILVVDDLEINRKTLVQSLRSHSYKNIITATNGSEALQLTYDRRPDIVILDLMMPEMDGLSYCKAIRNQREFDRMPILVQTAVSNQEHKISAFDLGANDYVSKPVDASELSARTAVHLVQRFLIADLDNYKTSIEMEMHSAKQMQNRLMPNRAYVDMCERMFNMQIDSYFETSSDFGGDYWGIRMLSDKRLAVYQFDFAGHGMSAAMNVFRMHTLMQECSYASGDPGNFLTTLNHHLYPLIERNEFATMFYGIIDTESNCLIYATAAMHAALLFKRGLEAPVSLEARGFPMGALIDTTYTSIYAPFSAGDLLLLFSDCLIESTNAKGEFLGDDAVHSNVRKTLNANPRHKPKDVIEALLEQLRSHAPGPLFDDLTISAYARN